MKTNKPKSRQSIACIPSTDAPDGRESVTADVGSTREPKGCAPQVEKKKKSRSKSLGPGGLEALKESAGNNTKVHVETSLQVSLLNF
jgi:kinetochore protein Spc7/SPC105